MSSWWCWFWSVLAARCWFDAAERGLTRYVEYKLIWRLWKFTLTFATFRMVCLERVVFRQGYLTKRKTKKTNSQILSGHINKDYENDLLMASLCWWPLDALSNTHFFFCSEEIRRCRIFIFQSCKLIRCWLK